MAEAASETLVFISHAGEDTWIARQIAREVTGRGARPFLGIRAFDKADIALGERSSDKIEEALRQAPVVVVLVGPNYTSSSWAGFELGAALGGNKKIIPIATQEIDHTRVSSLLRDRQWLQETSPQAAGKRVAQVLGHLTNRSAAGAD